MDIIASIFNAYIDANLERINYYGRDPGMAPQLMRCPRFANNVLHYKKDGTHWFFCSRLDVPFDPELFASYMTGVYREVTEDAIAVLGSRIACNPRLRFDNVRRHRLVGTITFIFAYTPVNE